MAWFQRFLTRRGNGLSACCHLHFHLRFHIHRIAPVTPESSFPRGTVREIPKYDERNHRLIRALYGHREAGAFSI